MGSIPMLTESSYIGNAPSGTRNRAIGTSTGTKAIPEPEPRSGEEPEPGAKMEPGHKPEPRPQPEPELGLELEPRPARTRTWTILKKQGSGLEPELGPSPGRNKVNDTENMRHKV